MTRARASAGFALVETLIASAIIAAMLGVTVDVLINQSRTTRMVEDRRLATLVAQSQMAAAIAATDAGQLDSHGRTSGVDWRVVVEPYATDYALPRLERVSVSAGRGAAGRPLVTLRSLRLAR